MANNSRAFSPPESLPAAVSALSAPNPMAATRARFCASVASGISAAI